MQNLRVPQNSVIKIVFSTFKSNILILKKNQAVKLLLVDWWSDVANKVLLGQGLVSEVKVKVCKGRLPFYLVSWYFVPHVFSF